MTEFKDTQQQLSKFRVRVAAAGLFVFVCFGLIGFRFLFLQVWHHSKYSLQADENRISVAPIVPNRGIITDRNGVVLAKNYSAYTLEITPSKLNAPLESVIDDLATVVSIDARDRRRFKKLQEDSKNFESLPIRTRLTDDEVARFTAQRFRFPGVEVRARLFRQYPLGPTAAHVIGYIGRISQRDQERIDDASDRNDSDPEHYDPRLDANNYKGTDYIGKIGVEQSYETELHGQTGFEEVEVTAGGRPVRTMSRTQATPGNNLVLSLDIGLQQVAEQAFAGRRGALVAIEPSTGDVLAFVSAPSFDPNSFVDGIDQQTWDELNNSPDHPLLNRPLHGTYPPGSTYKPFMALAALTLHKRTPGWGFQDPGSYTFGGHTFRNDVRSGQGWVDMNRAIVVSNDTYFYMLAHDLGVNNIANFMKPWGFGQITGIDIAGEARGILPSTDWKIGKVVRRRNDQPGHRPGLQLVHHSSTGARHGHAREQRRGDETAPRARHRKSNHQRHAPGRARSERQDSGEAVRHRHHQACDGRRRDERHGVEGIHRRAVSGGGQDRHGTGLLAAGRELQGSRDRRASARPRAFHRLRAGRSTEDRARADRRERRLGCGGGRPDRAQGARLLPRRQEQAGRRGGGCGGGGFGHSGRVRAGSRRCARAAGSDAAGQDRRGLYRAAYAGGGVCRVCGNCCFGGSGGFFGCGGLGCCGCAASESRVGASWHGRRRVFRYRNDIQSARCCGGPISRAQAAGIGCRRQHASDRVSRGGRPRDPAQIRRATPATPGERTCARGRRTPRKQRGPATIAR